jgi:hypothetical protein
MIDGMDCTCAAYGEHECCCGADWTTQETYDLREKNKILEAFAATNNFKVTRLEVIDHTSEELGRVLVKYNVDVKLSYQDDGKTLKLFLKDKEL